MPAARHHTPLRRDAAVNRLRRFNRAAVAFSLAATAVLTEVAAHAFPGHTIKRTAGSTTVAAATTPAVHHHRRHPTHHALKPPAAAPTTTQPAVETAPETAPTDQSAPAPVESAPAPVESAPADQSAPAPAQSAPPVESTPAPAPVVSGGS